MPITGLALGLIGLTLGLIAIDVFLAYFRALAQDNWDWAKAAQYLDTHILRSVGGLVLAALVQYGSQQLGGADLGTIIAKLSSGAIIVGGAAAIDAKLIKDIITKLTSFKIPGGTATG
jgi:ABC-type arginine transport system permease subunit